MKRHPCTEDLYNSLKKTKKHTRRSLSQKIYKINCKIVVLETVLLAHKFFLQKIHQYLPEIVSSERSKNLHINCSLKKLIIKTSFSKKTLSKLLSQNQHYQEFSLKLTTSKMHYQNWSFKNYFTSFFPQKMHLENWRLEIDVGT